MFHIKTDIRQYKCESEEKVERLIRNWVIRPSDLIYNADEKTWKPIGQHSAFDDIFAVIEQEESNEPDTIVTEAPSEVAAEHEVEPGAELESDEDARDEEELSDDEDEESLHEASDAAARDAVEEPPTVLDADRSELHADSEEITNVTEPPEKSDDADLEDEESTDVREDPRGEPDEESTDVREDPRGEPDEESTDVREDPRGEADEESTDVREDPRGESDEGQVERPEAPEGVAGVIRDSDEITMMTDRTFEMLREERGVDEETPSADAPEPEQGDAEPVVEPADEAISDEEPTQVVEREEVAGDSDASSEDVQQVDDRAGADDGHAADEPDAAAQSEDVDEDESEPEADEAPAETGKGRHGLPEEIFVTDEIPQAGVQQAVLDELGEVEHDGPSGPASEDTDITDGRDGRRQPRWRIVMSDGDVEDDEKVEADADANAGGAAAEHKPDSDVADDDDLDGMLDEAAELVGLGEESNPVTIEAAEIEPVDDDVADTAPRERAETPVREVAQNTTFVSEGYKLPLPIDVSPSAEDIRLGLKHSRVGKKKKDATFPHPSPKNAGEVTLRRFDLDPEEPRDHSFLLVASLVFGFVLVLLGAITLLG